MDSRFATQATKPLHILAENPRIEQDVHTIVEHPSQEGDTIPVQEPLD